MSGLSVSEMSEAGVAVYRALRALLHHKLSGKNEALIFSTTRSTTRKSASNCCRIWKQQQPEEGGTVDLLAFVYCDRNRQYFIASCSNISLGRQIQRTRVQQLTDVETNDDPVRVDMALDCPKAASTYFSTCGKIDQHNRCRQDTLNLEKKIQCKHWHKRVNMSIFGMIVVDSWMLYKGCTGGNQLNQATYYKALLDALIDEPLKTQPETRRTSMSTTSSGGSVSTSVCASGLGMHLTPTKRIAPATASSTGRRMQIKCRVCLQKTTWVCSLCHEDPKLGDIGAAYCHPKSGRVCYQRHMYEWHM